MSLHLLLTLPLAGAAVALLLDHWRRLTALAALATMAVCCWVVWHLPAGQIIWLGQLWLLDPALRLLLLYTYAATAVLLGAATITEDSGLVFPALLASVALFSAALLLQAPLLSLLLWPAGLILPVLATLPTTLDALRGAGRVLVWATLPIPFLLAAFWLLQRFSQFPEETVLPTYSAWLAAPALVLWLTLFPLDGTSHAWAEGSPPIAPAFGMAVKDPLLIYFWLLLWQSYGVLWTTNVAAAIAALAIVTAVTSGLSAARHSRASAVMACAATSTLGLAVQSIVGRTEPGIYAGLALLLSRSAAVLLVTFTLAALHRARRTRIQVARQLPRWQDILILAGITIGIAAFAGMSRWHGVIGPCSLHFALCDRIPNLVEKAWWIAALGIVPGLGRAVWAGWRESTPTRH